MYWLKIKNNGNDITRALLASLECDVTRVIKEIEKANEDRGIHWDDLGINLSYEIESYTWSSCRTEDKPDDVIKHVKELLFNNKGRYEEDEDEDEGDYDEFERQVIEGKHPYLTPWDL